MLSYRPRTPYSLHHPNSQSQTAKHHHHRNHCSFELFSKVREISVTETMVHCCYGFVERWKTSKSLHTHVLVPFRYPWRHDMLLRSVNELYGIADNKHVCPHICVFELMGNKVSLTGVHVLRFIHQQHICWDGLFQQLHTFHFGVKGSNILVKQTLPNKHSLISVESNLFWFCVNTALESPAFTLPSFVEDFCCIVIAPKYFAFSILLQCQLTLTKMYQRLENEELHLITS